MSAAASAGLSSTYKPYLSDSEGEGAEPGPGADVSSVSDTESEAGSAGSAGTSDEERITHDGRLQAMDAWRLEAHSWIAGPGTLRAGVAGSSRAPVSNMVLPPPSSMRQPLPPTTMTEVPLELRAHDIVRHVINIDSQFREAPLQSTSTNFYWRLITPVKNVMRIRVTSVEIPNNYPFFTRTRRTVAFEVTVADVTTIRYIEDGNYTADEMETALETLLKAANPSFTVTFSGITGKFTITNSTTAFSINWTPAGAFPLPDGTPYYYDRPFAWGLGAYLGFGQGSYSTAAPAQSIVSDGCANFAGDNYLMLKVNDFDCVRQIVNTVSSLAVTQTNDFTALAKIVLREPKNYMSFDDYASQHIKEVVFSTPRDLDRFHIQLLDPYGEPVNFCSGQFSFSLEVLEIRNPTLFDTVRDSIMMRYV